MAAISYPEAGTEFGECTEPCEHTDCASIRREKARLCALCEEPIGTQRFFSNDEGGVEHATCVYNALDVDRGAH